MVPIFNKGAHPVTLVASDVVGAAWMPALKPPVAVEATGEATQAKLATIASRTREQFHLNSSQRLCSCNHVEKYNGTRHLWALTMHGKRRKRAGIPSILVPLPPYCSTLIVQSSWLKLLAFPDNSGLDYFARALSSYDFVV